MLRIARQRSAFLLDAGCGALQLLAARRKAGVPAFSVAGTPGRRSPAHARGPAALVRQRCLVSTDQADTGSACREWGQAPANPKHPPCHHRGVPRRGQPTLVVVRWWRLRALSPIRGTLAGGKPGRWRRGSGGIPQPFAREVRRRTQVTPARYYSPRENAGLRNSKRHRERLQCAANGRPVSSLSQQRLTANHAPPYVRAA